MMASVLDGLYMKEPLQYEQKGINEDRNHFFFYLEEALLAKSLTSGTNKEALVDYSFEDEVARRLYDRLLSSSYANVKEMFTLLFDEMSTPFKEDARSGLKAHVSFYIENQLLVLFFEVLADLPPVYNFTRRQIQHAYEHIHNIFCSTFEKVRPFTFFFDQSMMVGFLRAFDYDDKDITPVFLKDMRDVYANHNIYIDTPRQSFLPHIPKDWHYINTRIMSNVSVERDYVRRNQRQSFEYQEFDGQRGVTYDRRGPDEPYISTLDISLESLL